MAQLSRRGFLGLVLGGGAFAAVGAAGVAFFTGDPAAVVRAVLFRRVGHLRVPRDSIARFADDYVTTKPEHVRTLSRLAILALPLRWLTPYPWLPLDHPLRRLEDNVVSGYLLSTDFFHQGADAAKPITYVGFYDPHLMPCRNPFARRAVADA